MKHLVNFVILLFFVLPLGFTQSSLSQPYATQSNQKLPQQADFESTTDVTPDDHLIEIASQRYQLTPLQVSNLFSAKILLVKSHPNEMHTVFPNPRINQFYIGERIFTTKGLGVILIDPTMNKVEPVDRVLPTPPPHSSSTPTFSRDLNGSKLKSK